MPTLLGAPKHGLNVPRERVWGDTGGQGRFGWAFRAVRDHRVLSAGGRGGLCKRLPLVVLGANKGEKKLKCSQPLAQEFFNPFNMTFFFIKTSSP